MSGEITVIKDSKNVYPKMANEEEESEGAEKEIAETFKKLENDLFTSLYILDSLSGKSSPKTTRLPEDIEYDELDGSLEEMSENPGKHEPSDDQIADIPRPEMLRLSLKMNGMRPGTPNSKYPPSVHSDADSGIGVCSPLRRKNEPFFKDSRMYQPSWMASPEEESAPMLRGHSGYMRSARSFNLDNGRNTPKMRNAMSFDAGAYGRFTPTGADTLSLRQITIPIGSTDGKRIINQKEASPEALLLPLEKSLETEYNSRGSFQRSEDGVYDEYRRPMRAQWANKAQFIFACVGYSVGLGNIWRFPYVCYKSGGGAFVVPYIIALIICGVPLMYMEITIGQFTRRGPIGAIGKLCPILKGAGLSSVIISFIMSTYLNVIIAYSLFYFFSAFKANPPWSGCGNVWNTPDCWMPSRLEDHNITKPNSSRTPSQEFFVNKVLQISSGIDDVGGLRWELAACLVVAWIMVYFSIWKSVKSSGKVLYFTATFPYVIILAFLVRSLTLEGAGIGLKFLFKPNWELLADSRIWVNAAGQVFSSLGLAFGAIVSFASYNKSSNRILVDTLSVAVINALTSLMVAIFAFATIGNIAMEHHTTVHDVITDGPGLVFVVYPQAMAKMPASQVWAVLFFFMLLCLGLNTQFAIVEVVVTSIQDGFPNWMRKHFVCHEVLVFVVCMVSFLIGIPNIFQGGIYIFQLIDHYVASISLMYLSFFEVAAIAWFYGIRRIRKNVETMTGERISFYFRFCWSLVTPVFILSVWIFSLIDYEPPTYRNGEYKYPGWAEGLGWGIASLSLACIPVIGIYVYTTAEGNSFREKMRNAATPHLVGCSVCHEDDCSCSGIGPKKEVGTLLTSVKLPTIIPISHSPTPNITIPLPSRS